MSQARQKKKIAKLATLGLLIIAPLARRRDEFSRSLSGRRWAALARTPLVDGSMAASSGVVPLAKVEKKIAQISRVIQHLNAKSDDSDLDSLAGSYENEIEGILRDASERVRRFHAASQHKHDNARLEARAEEIEARYEAQRVKALKEIEAFKKRAGAQQAELRKEAEAKVSAMAAQLEAAKREFATKMRQFAEAAETLQRQGAGSKELKAAHAKELEESQARHLREIEEVVRKHNGRYNEMMRERLEAEERSSP